MLLDIIFIIVGIVIVLWGADKLTEGAVAIASKMGIPQIVIGLTIVAMGTSMPEFCVSLVSAIKGTPDLAIGNVVGSNIFNAMLIVGVAAMFAPIAITHDTVKRSIPFAIISSFILMGMCADKEISRLDAAILCLMFIIFMFETLRNTKGKSDENVTVNMKIWKAVFWLIIGLVCLIAGSNLFVEGASKVAAALGVSDAVIGLTVVAGGTSLPELATSIVAAKKGNSGIAIGNVLGSNVYNILFILGITGLVCPMHIEGITNIDFWIMGMSMVVLWLFSYTKYVIARWEGAFLTIAFLGYMTYLIAGAV